MRDDDLTGLDEVELENEAGEVLPDREAMSIVTPPFLCEEAGGLTEGMGPLRGGEEI